MTLKLNQFGASDCWMLHVVLVSFSGEHYTDGDSRRIVCSHGTHPHASDRTARTTHHSLVSSMSSTHDSVHTNHAVGRHRITLLYTRPLLPFSRPRVRCAAQPNDPARPPASYLVFNMDYMRARYGRRLHRRRRRRRLTLAHHAETDNPNGEEQEHTAAAAESSAKDQRQVVIVRGLTLWRR